MGKYEVKEISSKNLWEKFVLQNNPKSFLQSWNWGETNKILGKKIFRLGFTKDKKLVGVCLVIEEKAKRGPHFLIPGGPLFDWENKRLVSFFLKTIKSYAVKQKVWFVRIRPELFDNQKNRKLFSSLGLLPAPMHLHAENTWVLEIDRNDDELLSGMRKTTRYLIKKSLDMNLSVKVYSVPDKTEILDKLQGETVKRHKFKGFSNSLFTAQLATFAKDGQAELVVCGKGEYNLAAAIIIFYGKYAYYHHSGSTSDFREIPFSYFLQWKIIQSAREKGMKFYNFWGIAPNDSPKHRFAGVTLFKTGFGGNRIDWLHAYDLPVSPLYFFTHVFETGRRIMRRL